MRVPEVLKTFSVQKKVRSCEFFIVENSHDRTFLYINARKLGSNPASLQFLVLMRVH